MSEEDIDFSEHGVPKTDEPFDESLFPYVCDAHCHPHDDIANISMIRQLQTGHITIMGVRQDDWDMVSKVAAECNKERENMCIPSFGIHPWFCYRLMIEEKPAKDHYKSVLTCPYEDELEQMIHDLKDPFPYEMWYQNLRQRLLDHPNAIVGEIGLDRAAKLLPGGAIEWHGVKPTNVQCSIEHQLRIFEIQSNLARELDRGISAHCVQGQGHLYNYLKEQSGQYSNRKLKKLNKPFSPLRLCLHSYGGSPATIHQFMQLNGFKIYISFSAVINARLLPTEKFIELIKAVPEDRLLIESDLNSPKGLDTCMIEIIKIIAQTRQWSVQKVVQVTQKNWQEFVGLCK
ncbi:hypothetical protein G6F70_002922 [Rhizopus microsporus]|uniref:Metallo-dependent hydrolase n=2 Tax=Rhizopus TaxID=4842 RepID=A0A367JIB9_RHIAZ|nr:hypothetical protein G6F71_002809 [Rhizopus microsporus]RCH89684.1 hypothetical protein CU097_007697 [Rhizopus azygosporus]KAG1201674.1 hypothetical protein G6F70_002922 [Rhizopus microsporus]KAG1206845.1 hypothetical protein G6F69_008523 [Rhizopus microsporus]KAG1227409.1 hypothetical protein G6F67_008470 [Rhizopus microsporus]